MTAHRETADQVPGKPPIRVCFVCLGNICRSPTAEGVMRALIARENLEGQIRVGSAGTAAYHIGESPDRRSRAAAKARGVELSSRARQFERTDWDRLDYVVAMDRKNFEDLAESAPNAAARAKLRLLRAFDPDAPEHAEVPDPFHGEADGFEEVLDLCEAGCKGLLAHIRREHQL